MLSEQTFELTAVTEENCRLRVALEELRGDADRAICQEEHLKVELRRQQTLYSELKKMRGRAEEMERIGLLQQVG